MWSNAAASALGADVQLAVDAVQGIARRPWPVKTAAQVARWIEPYDIRWIEEPIEVTDVAGMAELRTQINIPLAGGESMTTLAEAEGFVHGDAVDLLQVDAAVVGGIGMFQQITQLCRRKRLPVAVHAWGSGVSIMGNYHAAFASPECTLLEMPAVPNAFRDEVLLEPLVVRDQRFQAPTLPGLGVTLPEDIEKRFPYHARSYYRILKD